MTDAGPMGRNKTTGSAVGILALILVIVAIVIGFTWYIWKNPEILEDLARFLIILAGLIIIIVIIAYIIIAVLAVPYYALKGESYQTGATYDLNDVKSVKEKTSDSKKDDADDTDRDLKD